MHILENSCIINICMYELQAVKLLSCKESSITDMHFIDSPQAHILIFGCNGIDIKNLLIRAPETSPNTDGVHIQSSHNVFINNTIIGSGKRFIGFCSIKLICNQYVVITYRKCWIIKKKKKNLWRW